MPHLLARPHAGRREGELAVSARAVGFRVGAHWLVRELDLDLTSGSVVVVIGPNGAGKSTLLSLLAGDLQPTVGTVAVQGLPVRRVHPLELARLRAVLPQQPQLSFPFTVGEVVGMGRSPWAGTEEEDRDGAEVAAALRAADVADLAQRRYPTLSGGEQARTSLARVLAQATGVLLLDEPTAALDLRHQEAIMTTARECASAGTAVLAVLHDVGLAAAYADRIAVLHGGRVVADGPPAQVLTEPLLEQVYGLPIDVFTHPGHGGLVVAPRRTRRGVRGD